MKKKDLATILLISLVSIAVAYFAASAVFGGMQNETVQVKTVDAIDSEFAEVDKTIFNDQAINPTVPIAIEKDQ